MEFRGGVKTANQRKKYQPEKKVGILRE